MKKIIFLLGFISLFTVGTAYMPPAVITNFHFDIPPPHTVTNPCNGETVTFDGNVGSDIHVLINGNRINVNGHTEGHGDGSGSFGNSYISNVNENFVANGGLFSNGAFTVNDVIYIRLTGKGSAPNFRERITFHLTITPNGVVTVDRTDFETFCQ